MDRRRFLSTSMALGLGLACRPERLLANALGRVDPDTILLTLNLEGGPDFRFVFVPPYDESDPFSAAFWPAQALAHMLAPDDPEGMSARASEYLTLDDPAYHYFGVHPYCEWLVDMFNQGEVALINNVVASTNRDHDHSILILESANTEARPLSHEQSGWGGRLTHACDRNIVSVTHPLRLFCYGPHPTDPLSHDNARVISAERSRDMGLYEFEDYDVPGWQRSRPGQMSRALSSYYAAKAQSMDPASPYQPVLQREQGQRYYGRQMRESLFGQLVGDALEGVPMPKSLSDLHTENSPRALNSLGFGRHPDLGHWRTAVRLGGLHPALGGPGPEREEDRVFWLRGLLRLRREFPRRLWPPLDRAQEARHPRGRRRLAHRGLHLSVLKGPLR